MIAFSLTPSLLLSNSYVNYDPLFVYFQKNLFRIISRDLHSYFFVKRHIF